MTFGELKELVLFQMGQDKEDGDDLQPHLNNYVNEGYEMMCMAAGYYDREPMRLDREEPDLPRWMHQAIADWACYRFCLCGSASRQLRAAPFQKAFDSIRRRAEGRGCCRFRHWE